MSEFGVSQLGAFKPSPLRERFIEGASKESMASSPSVPGASSSQSFMDTLESVLQDTNKALKGADKAATDLTTGRADNLHNVMIAMEKADLSLRTVNSIRNKMVEAYQEIMRMQV